MSNQQDVISCNSSQLKDHVKCFISIDPKILAKGDIKIGDSLEGNILFSNRKVVSCKGFYIRLVYTSRFSTKMVTVSYLIVNGKTQGGNKKRSRINVQAIPIGTHKFPFSFTLPCDYFMVPIYPTTSDNPYAPQKYILEAMIVLTSSVSLNSIPVKITEYLNIRRLPEYHLPIQHRIKVDFSRFGTDTINILVTAPRSAYISGENLPFRLEISNGKNPGKIKKITVSFVMRYYMEVNSRNYRILPREGTKQYIEESLVSKTISRMSQFMQENLTLPSGLKQGYSVHSLEGREYFLKFLIEPTGTGKTTEDAITILIGTVDSPLVFNYQTLRGSNSSLTEETAATSNINSVSQSLVSLLLPTYSDVMGSGTSILRRANSITSLETLPPTFEEALQNIASRNY